MALIAEYLLLLARDPDAARNHRSSTDAARAQMTSFGLSQPQQDAIATNDPDTIANAVRAELPAGDPSDASGLPLFIIFMITPPDGK